jgi:hypothetical protein
MTLMPVPEKRPTKKEEAGWIDNLVGALTDPIIVFPNDWQHDIPEELKKQIPMERLIMNMKVEHEGKGVPVGDIEALVYMFPRTMEAPMTDEQNRLYFHCFNEAMKFMKVEVPDDLKEKHPLSQYEMHELDNLKRFIWDRRVKARKEKARGVTKAAGGETKKKDLEVKVSQPSFF